MDSKASFRSIVIENEEDLIQNSLFLLGALNEKNINSHGEEKENLPVKD